jgi:hypothetical protein
MHSWLGEDFMMQKVGVTRSALGTLEYGIVGGPTRQQRTDAPNQASDTF